MIAKSNLFFFSLIGFCLGTFVKVTAAPDEPLLYVADQGANRIIVIDPANDRIVREIAVAPNPASIASARHSSQIYVTHPDSGEVSVVDLKANSSHAGYVVGGSPFGIAALDDQTFVYGDWNAGTLTRMQLQTGEITGQIAIGRSPAAVVADHAGHRLYVAEREEAAIGIIDVDTFTHIATLAVGQSPFALAITSDDRHLYVANVRSNTVSVVDTKSLVVIATIDAGVSPYGLALTTDGLKLLVSNQQAGTITVIETKQFNKVATIKVGRDPEGIVVSSQFKKAYVMNWFSGDISVIDLVTDQETTRIKTGGGPRMAISNESQSTF